MLSIFRWPLRRLAFAIVLLGGLFPPAALAAPSTMFVPVTETGDPPPAVCSFLQCSLREAIIFANADPGPNIIVLKNNTTYHVSTAVPGVSDDATVGDLNITDDLSFDFADCSSRCRATIQGSSATGNDRVFSIDNQARVQMTELVIQGGYIDATNHTTNRNGGGVYIGAGSILTLTNSLVRNNYGYNGGGLYDAGSLVLNGTTVAENVATQGQGGGIWSLQGGGVYAPVPLVIDHSNILTNLAQTEGGGLFVWHQLAITDTTIRSNTAITGNGAGLYVNNDPATLANVQILSNTALAGTSMGGGLYAVSAPLTVAGSTLGWNTAAYGGGLATYVGAIVQLANSTVRNNTANAGDGGGIEAVDFFQSATYTVTNVIFSDNRATGSGGGLYASQLALDGDTFSHNTADSDHNGSGDGGGFFKPSTLPLLITHSAFTGNSASSGGGFVARYVSLSQTTVQSNTATTGDGGGFYSDGSITLSHATIQGNTAVLGRGAGFSSGGSVLSVSDSAIVSNTAPSSTSIGGGIFDWTGAVTLTNSTLGWNSAAYGGGLAIYAAGTAQVANSAVINNRASVDGGGFYDVDFFNSSVFTLTNSTVSGNRANGSGGGLLILNAYLNHVTLSHNTADDDHNGSGDGGGLAFIHSSPAVIADSILGGNVGQNGQPNECAGGTLDSHGYNLIQITGGCALTDVTIGNHTGVNPLLGPLQDNGGPTWTQALLTNSPAINAGNPSPATCPATDQRGAHRPVGGRCDIGAYEAGGIPPLSHHLYLPISVR